MKKDAPILDLLTRLRESLGPDAFVIVDHWSSDRCAIGVARVDNTEVLAYISTAGQPVGRYALHLEFPAAAGSKLPYTPAGKHEGVDFERLLRLLAGHLGVRSPSPPA